MTLQHLSEVEILLKCSSSPSAEGPDFVENQKRYAYCKSKPRLIGRVVNECGK